MIPEWATCPATGEDKESVSKAGLWETSFWSNLVLDLPKLRLLSAFCVPVLAKHILLVACLPESRFESPCSDLIPVASYSTRFRSRWSIVRTARSRRKSWSLGTCLWSLSDLTRNSSNSPSFMVSKYFESSGNYCYSSLAALAVHLSNSTVFCFTTEPCKFPSVLLRRLHLSLLVIRCDIKFLGWEKFAWGSHTLAEARARYLN